MNDDMEEEQEKVPADDVETLTPANQEADTTMVNHEKSDVDSASLPSTTSRQPSTQRARLPPTTPKRKRRRKEETVVEEESEVNRDVEANSLEPNNDDNEKGIADDTRTFTKSRTSKKTVPTRKSPRKKVEVAKENVEEAPLDDGDDEDFEVEDDEEEKDEDGKEEDGDEQTSEPFPKRKRRKRRRVKQNNEGEEGDGETTSEDLSCPHCHRVFSTHAGRSYHIKNYVCRQNQRPGGPVIRGRRKAAKPEAGPQDEDQDGPDDNEPDHSTDGEDQNKKRKFKRLRGSLKNRTCDRCQRVFTSTLGLAYHKENNVCQVGKNRTESTPFPTLEAGECFVTPYGIAKVVNDDRAVPSANPSPSLKELHKAWVNAKSKREAQVQRLLFANAVKQRVRRALLQRSHERQHETQASVFRAYFDGDPRRIHPSTWGEPLRLPPLAPDPSEPADSYPDRIVECILIPDRRARYDGPNDATDVGQNPESGGFEAKLFLRRRCLTEPYLPNGKVYMCVSCGKAYASRLGCKYHVESQACANKAKAAQGDAASIMAKVEFQYKRTLANLETGRVRSATGKTKNVARKKRAILGMYPQVVVALGFKLVALHDAPITMSAFYPAKTKRASVASKGTTAATPEKVLPEETASVISSSNVTTSEETSLVLGDSSVRTAPILSPDSKKIIAPNKVAPTKANDELERPDITIARLTEELRHLQAKLPYPMYPTVFRALEYKRARDKPPPAATAAAPKKKKLEPPKAAILPVQEPVVLLPRKPMRPPPPIIDVRVLVAEILAGRYVKYKRQPILDHVDRCVICKKNAPPLLGCDFCKNSVHLACIRSKFTLKDPEPDDAFLCHLCIQYIMSQRVRAEKRRLERLGVSVTEEGACDQDSHNKKKKAKPKQEMSESALAAQGRQLDEVVTLLRDAKTRLSHELVLSQMNRIRLSWIEPLEAESMI